MSVVSQKKDRICAMLKTILFIWNLKWANHLSKVKILRQNLMVMVDILAPPMRKVNVAGGASRHGGASLHGGEGQATRLGEEVMETKL